MQTFALTGAAGYVAARHIRAISELKHSLVAVLDPHDTLGILDQYFSYTACFAKDDAFAKFLHNHPVDYLSVCSPNHLHYGHIAMGLQNGADVICEKPLVIDPQQIEQISALEQETGRKVKTILQLRLLPAVAALKRTILPGSHRYTVNVTYVSSRGPWYFNSWKGQDQLSGGLVTNIGIHLFDLLIWMFGEVHEASVTQRSAATVAGHLALTHADVNWFLSVDGSQIPSDVAAAGKRTYRILTLDGLELRLDDGLDGLHTACYQQILNGGGPGLKDAAPSIMLCHRLNSL